METLLDIGCVPKYAASAENVQYIRNIKSICSSDSEFWNIAYNL